MTAGNLRGIWGDRGRHGIGFAPTVGKVSNRHPTTRGKAADAVATLIVLVVGSSLLAMTAPLVSAVAVALTAVLYIPVRLRAV